MISASHNPFYDNGIKLFGADGEKMADAAVRALERYLDGEGELPLATGADIGVAVDHAAGGDRYAAHLRTLATASYRSKRVGLDCANGCACRIAKEMFEALGATVYAINDAPNGTNINLNCGSTHIEALRRLVTEQRLDVGFAFDGDADRCIAVDHLGNPVDGDGILYVMGRSLKERGLLKKDTVVTTVMSNLGLYRAFDALDIRYETTAVGDRYVRERMAEKGYSLGGEQSGHIIFGNLAGTGDGLITALMLMDRICDSGSTLHGLTEGFCRYPQALKSVRVSDKEAVMRDGNVLAAIAAAEAELGDGGRALVRASGTEPVVRVMVEAEAHEVCERLADSVISAIREKGLGG